MSTYWISIHPTGETPMWVGTAFMPEAALGALHGMARIATNPTGGWFLVWDSTNLGNGPVAGAEFLDKTWWPDNGFLVSGARIGMSYDSTPLQRIMAQVQTSIAGVSDWFSEFTRQWASNWWRR